jgi:hypothetical protein
MDKHLTNLLWVTAWAILGCGTDVKIVEVDPSNISFTKPSQSEKINAKAQDIHGGEIPGISFSYSSENPSVATVDADGTIKPAGNGSTAITAKTPSGVTGEAFVKVCLPKEITCDPPDKLMLKVGVSAPIKCEIKDCDDKKIQTRAVLTQADKSMLLKEGDDIFIGLKVGDTSVKVEAFGMEKTVAVRVDEQTYLPGMGPGSGGGGGGGGGGGNREDPYTGGGGRFDHILKNMKFGN